LETNNTALVELSKGYRKKLFEKFVEVGQGHPGSTFSMIEIVTSLFHGGFYRKGYDRVIVSKGHATVALYPILVELGILNSTEWANWGNGDSCLRVFGNNSIPGIDVTSGSLGHGVGVGFGMAYSAFKEKKDRRVFVVISEGELYEGSTWESLLLASHHKLTNLSIVIDINSLIILGKTDDCVSLDPIKKKMESFDFDVYECDGHSVDELVNFYAAKSDKTKVLLANTVKGKGFSLMENKANWHYMNALSEQDILSCREELK